MTHTTDSIEQALISKALAAERNRIATLTAKYLADLGQDTNIISLTVQSVSVSPAAFFTAYQDALLSSRTESISATAITQFLLDYDAFCASKENPA